MMSEPGENNDIVFKLKKHIKIITRIKLCYYIVYNRETPTNDWCVILS